MFRQKNNKNYYIILFRRAKALAGKGIFYMKEKVIKTGVVSVVGAIMSIVPVMGYYPFAGAYSVALMSSYCMRMPGITAMILMILLNVGRFTGLKYALIVATISVVIKLLEEKGSRLKIKISSVVGAVVVFIMEITDMIGKNISKAEMLILSGLVLITFSFGILLNIFIKLYLDSGNKIDLRFKKKVINDMGGLNERLSMIGNSFIKLSKITENAYINKATQNNEISVENIIIASEKMESKRLISMYLKETGNIIKGLSSENTGMISVDIKKEEKIGYTLDEIKLKCMDVMIINEKGREKVIVKMKSKGSNIIKLSQVEKCISNIMNKKYVSTHDKKYVENKLTTYTFIPDTNYFVMHGIAKKTINESGSGDNFSCINLDNGQTLLSISDGMGTGDKANWESSQVVELIEEFSQCGYSEELTLTLINNLFISKADMSPATVDMSIIDKHSGMCDIVKSGAATTYVKREGWVEAIKSTSLPIGVMGNVDVETAKKKLYDGDFVIMVSDGILESVCEEEKDEVISNIILEAKSKKPKELAFEILNKVCEINDNRINDDMTVLVTGIWDKIA